jgi:hypothetical protein
VVLLQIITFDDKSYHFEILEHQPLNVLVWSKHENESTNQDVALGHVILNSSVITSQCCAWKPGNYIERYYLMPPEQPVAIK